MFTIPYYALLSHSEGYEMYQGYRVNKRLTDVHPTLDIDVPLPIIYMNRLDTDSTLNGGGLVTSTDSIREYGQQEMRHQQKPAEVKVTGEMDEDLRRDFVVDYALDETDAALCGYIQASENFPITPNAYEVFMSLLDHGVWILSLKLPLGHTTAVDEAQPCSICGDAECYPENSIVFCDGCDIAVHQDCYGVPFIPKGQWLCRCCLLVGRNARVHCKMCPRISGAMKQTTNLNWVHMICAQYIPELEVPDDALMEPIEGLELVPYDRYALRCLVCKKKSGACIQCAYGHCTRAFHVTCAQAAHLHMAKPSAFCPRHTPGGDTSSIDLNSARASLEAEEKSNKDISLFSKPRYPYWRTPTGVFCIPASLRNAVSNVWTELTGLRMPHKVLNELCQFWTIKRDANGGMFTRSQRLALEVTQRSHSRPLSELQTIINKADEGALLAQKLKDILVEGEAIFQPSEDLSPEPASDNHSPVQGSPEENDNSLFASRNSDRHEPQILRSPLPLRRQSHRVEKTGRLMNRIRQKKATNSQKEAQTTGIIVAAARQASRSGFVPTANRTNSTHNQHTSDESQVQQGEEDEDRRGRNDRADLVQDHDVVSAGNTSPEADHRGLWSRAFDMAKGLTKNSGDYEASLPRTPQKRTPQRVARRELDQAMSVLSNSPQTRHRRQA